MGWGCLLSFDDGPGGGSRYIAHRIVSLVLELVDIGRWQVWMASLLGRVIWEGGGDGLDCLGIEPELLERLPCGAMPCVSAP